MTERNMNTIKLTAKIDTTEIDKAIEKAVKLRELLKEANSLARELDSGVIMNGDKKTAPHEVASHGMPEEDFQRLKDLAETKYRSILQVVVSPDAVSDQHGDNL